MKKHNITIIAVVLLVGLIALVVMLRMGRKSTFRQDYHIEDTSSIVKIFMADKSDNQVTLTRV